MKKDKVIFFYIIFSIITFQTNFCFSQNADAEILLNETKVSILNGKLTRNTFIEIRINNRNAEKYTDIDLMFSKKDKLTKIDAFIKDLSGSIIKKIKAADIKTRSAISDFSFYEDNFVKEFSLKHNVYPYILCYQYQEEQSSFLYLEHWSPVINLAVPTHKATLQVQVPKDYKISVKNQFVESYKTDTNLKFITHTWTASYVKQIEPEIYSPYLILSLPHVFIVPDKFNFEIEGSFASWNDYGNWQNRIMEGMNDLTEDEKVDLLLLIKGVSNPKEKIKILYHYLQDVTRYINVTIETGGMKPYPASYVSINKYGDCKALTNYFKSVLELIGIESYYSKVYANDVIKPIDKTFPSQQFNHVILCVPFEKDTIWLDCTSKGPFNYLGTFTQNRDAFLVENENSRFVNTPPLTEKQVQFSRKIKIKQVSSSNNINLDFKNTYRGNMFEYLSGANTQTNETNLKQIITDNCIVSGVNLLDFKLIPSHRDSNFITLNYQASSKNIYQKYGNELIMRMIPFAVPAFKDFKTRKNPVQFNYPIYRTDTIEYEIPNGYLVTTDFKKQTIETDYGSYSLKFSRNNDNIQILKSFSLKAGYYTAEQYKALYDFVQQVKDSEKNVCVLTNKL
jgi:hypothetical protein